MSDFKMIPQTLTVVKKLMRLSFLSIDAKKANKQILSRWPAKRGFSKQLEREGLSIYHWWIC